MMFFLLCAPSVLYVGLVLEVGVEYPLQAAFIRNGRIFPLNFKYKQYTCFIPFNK